MGELRFLVGVLGIYVLCIFIAQSSWVQFLALTLYFLWITLHLKKGVAFFKGKFVGYPGKYTYLFGVWRSEEVRIL